MKTQGTEWFADWFDTTYYHTLYKNRDLSEAEQFIQRLIKRVPIPTDASVLDLACGKGRHAITLSECGFNVLGVDLSANSICEAKKYESDSLSFEVHDMREVIPNKQFDAVFNLFTSFGYFDSIIENQRVIHSIAEMLRPNGFFVIDFMNSRQVVTNLVAEETKIVDGITFHIERKFDGTHIVKEIQFEADGREHAYSERVQGLVMDDFHSLLTTANFQILHSFGNFNLDPFDEIESDRLIIIAQLKTWD